MPSTVVISFSLTYLLFAPNRLCSPLFTSFFVSICSYHLCVRGGGNGGSDPGYCLLHQVSVNTENLK